MEKCEWKYDADAAINENHYQTECGGDWFFFEGTIKENQMILCPFCGELIFELESIVQIEQTCFAYLSGKPILF